MRASLSAIVGLGLLGNLSAAAAPITLFDDFVTADNTIAAPVHATAALAGPLGLVGGLQSGPITVTAPAAGVLTITVTDIGEVGDVFQVFGNGVPLGTTTPVAVDGPNNSTGVFTLATGPGADSVDIWDYILSYEGGNSPYVGAVSEFSPADLEVKIAFTVPEPSSAALVIAGMLGAGWLRYRSVRDRQHSRR